DVRHALRREIVRLEPESIGAQIVARQAREHGRAEKCIEIHLDSPRCENLSITISIRGHIGGEPPSRRSGEERLAGDGAGPPPALPRRLATRNPNASRGTAPTITSVVWSSCGERNRARHRGRATSAHGMHEHWADVGARRGPGSSGTAEKTPDGRVRCPNLGRKSLQGRTRPSRQSKGAQHE